MLRGIECDILPDGRLDLPDDVLAELDWVQASVHGGQRMPRREMTARVEDALRNPHVRCLSHPTGRYINRRPENALDLDRVYRGRARARRRAGGQRAAPPPRPERRARPRRAAGGRRIVCSTDAHSVQGLDNMALSVATARRGWATRADVVNTGRSRTCWPHAASDPREWRDIDGRLVPSASAAMASPIAGANRNP